MIEKSEIPQGGEFFYCTSGNGSAYPIRRRPQPEQYDLFRPWPGSLRRQGGDGRPTKIAGGDPLAESSGGASV